MSFIIDKQTLDDLGVFSHKKEISVYAMYNKSRTRGGSQILEDMFYNPLDDYELIRRRSALIGYFQQSGLEFPFKTVWFDAAEFYLSDTDERTRITADSDDGNRTEGITLQHKIRRFIKTDSEFEQAQNGILSLIKIINSLDVFTAGMLKDDNLEKDSSTLSRIREIIESSEFKPIIDFECADELSRNQAASFDSLLRYDKIDQVRLLLDYIYHLDVYMSIAAVAQERGFVKAQVLPKGENVMEMESAFHPMLKNPVSNDLIITSRNNIVFLTGANMAGKSTFMKTFGICVFLAHVGFPVPAASMRFSVRDGLFTTINLPDSLNQGFSHFYAEVRRLKRVAQTVSRYQDMVIIFDELFRGTNVKDAFDATVAVTEAFSHIKSSIFMISTHIIEAGDRLKDMCDNIEYIYLPTIMDGTVPSYTYRLKKGITEDRHGMVIIRKEGILDILKLDK